MGNSYVRQSAADIQTGNIVEADPINAEFNALQSAFDASAGHSHDGTIGEGQKISLTSSIVGVLPVANGGTGGLHNTTATTSPSVTNDSTQGYAPGSIWVNNTFDYVYFCADSTPGAAVWNTYQPWDAGLFSISGLTTSADKTIYTTASDTYATTTLTAYGRTLIDDADAATARTTLGLGTIATQNANAIALTGGTAANLAITGGTVSSLTTPLAADSGGTGVTTLSALKTAIALNNVDNTSDVNKPVSTATQTALNLKANQSTTYTKTEVDTSLNLKANQSTTYTKTEVDTSLNLKVNSTGGTMSADPTVALGVATKQYVDGKTTGITNANLATMAEATVKGRAVGAGTGVPTDLNDAALFAILGNLVPAKPSSTAGIAGQIVLINPAPGTDYTLPSGGTWVVFRQQFSTTSAAYTFIHNFSLMAGGASIGAPSPGFAWVGWAWRIA